MASDQTNLPALNNESGITEQERAEIQAHIEHVATENRITVDASHFSLKSARRGLLFPLLVNGIAVIGALAVILLLGRAFRADAQEVQTQVSGYSSIEGRLIRELRAESRQLLQAKEREIELVRRQLQELEAEQAALEESIEERLTEREAELRQQLQEEIEAERARLIAEGLGDDEIERLMEQFEAERRAYYEQQLEEYRQELEAERAALQADIDRLRQEYNSRLQELERERQAIIAEYEQREEDLRVELEQRTAVLERIRSETAVDLEQAQRELARLERQEQQVQAVEDQIVGQMDRIRDALLNQNPQTAVTRIDALLDFLQEESVVALTELSERRAVDVFLLNQLRSLLTDQLEEETGTGTLTSELRLLGQIRSLSRAAQGTTESDRTLEVFDELVRTIPEVAVAHRALVEDAVDTAVTNLREQDREAVERTIQSATESVTTGNYDRALADYESALAATPALQPDLSKMMTDLLVLGYSLTTYTREGTETPGMEEISSRAEVDLQAERQAFLDQIQTAVARREAELNQEIRQLRTAMTQQLNQAVQEKEEELQARISTLNEQLEEIEAERSRLLAALETQREQFEADRAAEEAQREIEAATERARAESLERVRELDNQIAALEEQLEQERDLRGQAIEDAVAEAEAALAETQAALAALETQRREELTQAEQLRTEQLAAAERERRDAVAETEALRVRQLDEAEAARLAELDQLAEAARTERGQLAERIAGLVAFQDQLEAVQATYREYVVSDAQARQANPDSAVNASRQELNQFLQADEIQTLLSANGETLGDRISSLFREFQSGVASSALADAAVKIQDIAAQPTVQASRALLAVEIEDAQGNDALLEILQAVDELLAQAE
jgi:DNA repair exonuclease SbcCD ATPase subunit